LPGEGLEKHKRPVFWVRDVYGFEFKAQLFQWERELKPENAGRKGENLREY
jgi:hypothetical protein